TLDDSRLESGIKGDHLVGPDGTINLGAYGQCYVAGLTIAQARKAIEKELSDYFVDPKVSVDVKAYNSQVYYVVLKSDQNGDSIWRYPITGNETVLDAIAQVKGITGLSQANIWISRGTPPQDTVIKLDWNKVLNDADGGNPQVLPGDRIFIKGATL